METQDEKRPMGDLQNMHRMHKRNMHGVFRLVGRFLVKQRCILCINMHIFIKFSYAGNMH